jgi:hypothetical protein
MPDRIARFLALSQCCLQRTTAAAVSICLAGDICTPILGMQR